MKRLTPNGAPTPLPTPFQRCVRTLPAGCGAHALLRLQCRAVLNVSHRAIFTPGNSEDVRLRRWRPDAQRDPRRRSKASRLNDPERSAPIGLYGSRRSRGRWRRPRSAPFLAFPRAAWGGGGSAAAPASGRCFRDLNSARLAPRVACAWLARVECEQRPPAGVVDRRLLAAKLTVADLADQERRAAAAVPTMVAI